MTEVETCFVDQRSYAACKQPEGTPLPIGSGSGEVEVSAATDAGYTIIGHSQSGASFTVVKAASGDASRTCDKPGKAGCLVNGTW